MLAELDNYSALVALGLGARVLEKHLHITKRHQAQIILMP